MERRGAERAAAARAAPRSTSASTRARRSRGAVRYLELAEQRFGRDDLAVVSYHMGIGNLESVLDAYGERDASWARVYFDATPRNHPRAYRLLQGSATTRPPTYGASTPPGRSCGSTARTPASCAGAPACRPPRRRPRRCSTRARETKVFESADDLDDAYRSGELRPFEGIRGMRLDPQAGELAGRLDAEPPALPRAAPEAYELAVYLAAGVRRCRARARR